MATLIPLGMLGNPSALADATAATQAATDAANQATEAATTATSTAAAATSVADQATATAQQAETDAQAAQDAADTAQNAALQALNQSTQIFPAWSDVPTPWEGMTVYVLSDHAAYMWVTISGTARWVAVTPASLGVVFGGTFTAASYVACNGTIQIPAGTSKILHKAHISVEAYHSVANAQGTVALTVNGTISGLTTPYMRLPLPGVAGDPITAYMDVLFETSGSGGTDTIGIQAYNLTTGTLTIANGANTSWLWID